MIYSICKEYGITNYTINPDGSIDVDGDVWLHNKGLTELPLVFNKVTGYFNCSNNDLTNLKGCPMWTGDYFSCSENNLTSLEFGPDYVGGSFYCSNNNLTDSEIDTGGLLLTCWYDKEKGLSIKTKTNLFFMKDFLETLDIKITKEEYYQLMSDFGKLI